MTKEKETRCENCRWWSADKLNRWSGKGTCEFKKLYPLQERDCCEHFQPAPEIKTLK